MWHDYVNAYRVEDVLNLLANRDDVRIIAGGTDLVLEIERGTRKNIHTLIDISRIPGLNHIDIDQDGFIHIGSTVTHNDCIASDLLKDKAFPLVSACWQIGSPQIRNRGTVAGNLITASPANDTIPALIALDAQVLLKSVRGSRTVKLTEFYRGVRKTVMEPDEMLMDISFKAMETNQRGVFLKNALRRAQAIALVNVSIILTFDQKDLDTIESAKITFGSVAPTIVRCSEAESYLVGKKLTAMVIEETAELAINAIHPITDIRSSMEYRREMVRIYTSRALEMLASKTEKQYLPINPVLLKTSSILNSNDIDQVPDWAKTHEVVLAKINGEIRQFENVRDKTLLDMLREDAGLIGTKEGCGEGECGACTIHLDGAAIMGCLVPAGRADGAEITTIEGIANGDTLHSVQQAFIDEGAVQCGYCTPGFIMSSVKLLQEVPAPTTEQIKQAITGNLCRCTGYYSIIKAIEHSIRTNE